MKQMVNVCTNYFFLFYKQLREYKLNLFFSIVKLPISFALIWFLWSYIYTGTNQDNIAGYSHQNIIFYFIVMQWLGFLTSFKLSENVSEEIRNGQLTAYLSKPMYYFPSKISHALGQWSFLFVISFIPFLILHKVIYHHDSSMHIANIIMLLNSAILFLVFEFLLGIVSFWLNKIFGLSYFIALLLNVFGGKLIPLSFFPDWFQAISYILPTRYIYYEPALVLTNTNHKIFELLLCQWAYICVLCLIIYFVWGRGRKIYEATG